MKYIVATSDRTYFHWQMLVQINNFKKLGLLDDLIYVVGRTSKRKSKYLGYIEKETGVEMYVYDDTRESKHYTSSIRPHILSKFFKDKPEYSDCYYYLDPDVIFTEKPEYPEYIKRNKFWYVSDTISYIGSKYIKNKSEKLFEEMCDIVGIDTELVERYESQAGGAQYIMKNIDYKFWDKVEEDSEKLYLHMAKTSNKYNPKHPIQKWTADMWALLWNAWLDGHRTIVWKYLDFTWATSTIQQTKINHIFHNAGVTEEKEMFYKGKYNNNTPFRKDFNFINKKRASYIYVQEIKDTEKNYPELIKKL